MKTQLTQWGNSLAVRIPKPVAQAAELRKGDHLIIEVPSPGTVQVRKKKLKPTLAELLRGITAENLHGETGWGGPVGKDLW